MGPFCVSTGDYRPATGPGHKTSTYWGLSMSYNEAKIFLKADFKFPPLQFHEILLEF